jgi:hypothetical protein
MPAPAVGEKNKLLLGMRPFEFAVLVRWWLRFPPPVPSFSKVIVEPGPSE